VTVTNRSPEEKKTVGKNSRPHFVAEERGERALGLRTASGRTLGGLKNFRLTEHPLIIPHIDGMKSEIIKYQALVKSIKPLDQRKDAKGKDTFVLSDWWRCNSGELPHFAFVLRAVLTNAPNSCPPERLFSMFNATFGEDQQRSFGDYLELAMQSQYNKRNV
jgi:hypothetical protein